MQQSLAPVIFGKDTLFCGDRIKSSATFHVNAGYPFMMFKAPTATGHEYVTMDINNVWHLRLYNKMCKQNNINWSITQLKKRVFSENVLDIGVIKLIGSRYRYQIPKLDYVEGEEFENSPFPFRSIYLNIE